MSYSQLGISENMCRDQSINWNEFLGVSVIFLFYPYIYNCELYIFDKLIFVKLICYCVEREPYKSNIFLINMN